MSLFPLQNFDDTKFHNDTKLDNKNFDDTKFYNNKLSEKNMFLLPKFLKRFNKETSFTTNSIITKTCQLLLLIMFLIPLLDYLPSFFSNSNSNDENIFFFSTTTSNQSLNDHINIHLKSFWTTLKHQPFFKHKMFEAYLSSLSFMTWFSFFGFFVARFPNMTKLDGREVDHSGYKNRWHWYAVNMILYNGLIYLWHLRVNKVDPSNFEEITYGKLLVEVITGIFLYDLCFYPIHILFHKGPNFLRKLHVVHHDGYCLTKPISVDTTIHHSFIDGFLQVFVNVYFFVFL